VSRRTKTLGLVLVICAVLAACRKEPAATSDRLDQAYDTEPDWNDPQHLIPLNYQQAQGKRVFYEACVWCHADSTPAGPSNRSNLNPTPALMNDGSVLNPMSDEYLRNIIELGGSAVGKSGLMPPWGKTLASGDIRAVIAYMRAIAQPPYQPPARPASQYLVK
jgi:cytochrome c5